MDKNSGSIKNISEEDANDFLWSDFVCGEDVSSNDIYGTHNIYRNVGRLYSAKKTIRYLQNVGCLSGIIRGHQDMFCNSKVILNDKQVCKQFNKLKDDQPVDWKQIKIAKNNF